MNGLMMDTPLTLQGILRRSHQVFPEKEVVSRLEDGSIHRTTYGELYGRVLRLMDALRKLGVGPGDRVATFAWNSYRHLELYFAIPCLGAVLHTINVRLTKEQLVYIVGHAKDKLIFADHCLLDALAPMAGDLPTVERVVVMDDAGHGAEAAAELGIADALDYEALLSGASETEDFPALDEQQAAGLCYTSGTTGDPKGVLYSHRAYWLHSLGSTGVDSMAVSQRETVLPVVPMFHANAWGFPYTSAFTGAKLVMPGMHLLGKPLAELIEAERVTLAAGVPTIWNVLLQHVRKNGNDLSSLRTMIVGGSAAPVALIRAFKEELGVDIIHAWGMTETTPVGCCSRLKTTTLAKSEDEQIEAKKKQGVPVPGVEVRVVADDGSVQPWDGRSIGELCVRGPWVAKAYYEDDRADVWDDEGWFHTGDVVSIDELAYIEITDRKKDLIKTRGEWISTVDMENAAMAHAGVLEAAVTGRPDDLRDEVPVLWVVPDPEAAARPEPAELVEHLAANFAQWQLPKLEDVRYVEAIPKTSVGKFDKKVLRRQLAEETAGS